jgi:hypothetical protein
LPEAQQPGQQRIEQTLAAIDGVIQGRAGARISLERIQGQGEELLAVVAALALQDHQIGPLKPRREGQLVADAGQARGVAAVLAEHHQGPDQQGD